MVSNGFSDDDFGLVAEMTSGAVVDLWPVSAGVSDSR